MISCAIESKSDHSILPTVCIQLDDRESSENELGADARYNFGRISWLWMKVDHQAHATAECTFGGDANLIPTRNEKVQPDSD